MLECEKKPTEVLHKMGGGGSTWEKVTHCPHTLKHFRNAACASKGCIFFHVRAAQRRVAVQRLRVESRGKMRAFVCVYVCESVCLSDTDMSPYTEVYRMTIH